MEVKAVTNVMFQWFYTMPEEGYSTDGTGGQGPGTGAVDAINRQQLSCIFSSWVSATNF